MDLARVEQMVPETNVRVQQRFVQCLTQAQLHRMAYQEWGDPNNPRVLVCVHGLARNGHDFDVLAQALCQEYRVICPDVAGRGRSEWLNDKTAYAVPVYVQHMVTLLARLGVDSVDWLGTSMGGLIGMALAALPENPIRRLILNDIGPVLSAPALSRIAGYVGRASVFATEADAETYLRGICAGFGPLTDAQWHSLTRHALRRDPDGWQLSYDPAIGDAMRATPVDSDIQLWDVYDAIACPTLVLHGLESDLLLPETIAEMARRGPRARCIDVPETGHAPMLMTPTQIAQVRAFLTESPS